MTTTSDRRAFLRRAGQLGAGGAIAGIGGGLPRPAAAQLAELGPFAAGVASGDPGANSVVLWTYVQPPAGHDGAAIPVTWQVSSTIDFAPDDIVATGTVDARAENGYTVKPIATGLAPFAYHWYRFGALGAESIVGRTKTAPAPGQALDSLRFGFVSCSNYEGGYFNAYARLAERNDLDAVLCAGDYLYEYGAGEYGPGADIGRVHEPALEMTTLDEYRARFFHYRKDPDLRRLHQLYPWINTWDDHETTNDSWRDGAENHDEDGEFESDKADPPDDNPAEVGLSWEERKRSAWKAYREWLPIQVPADDLDAPIVLYRTLAFGDLADLVVLDTRIDDRDEPLFGVGAPDAGSGADDPDRRMISDAQRAMLSSALSTSTAAWRLILQQVMMMQWNAGGLPAGLAGNDFPDLLTGTGLGGGNALNGDAWDGYPAERARLFAQLRDEDIRDVVVLTGDIHSAWAADLTEDPYDPLVYDPTGQNPLAARNLGVEFVVTSVTSDNIDDIVIEGGGPAEAGIAAARAAEEATKLDNPHIKTVELERHGYGIVEVTAERTTYDIFFCPKDEPSAEETHFESWYVPKSSETERGHRVLAADAPTATRSDTPPAPDALPPAQTAPSTTMPVPAGPSLPTTGGGGWLAGGAAAAAVAAVLARRASTRTDER